MINPDDLIAWCAFVTAWLVLILIGGVLVAGGLALVTWFNRRFWDRINPRDEQ